MEKLARLLGLALCLEAAAFGHFEHKQAQEQGYAFHKNWSVRLAVVGGELGPMTADSSAPDPAEDQASMADYGPCAGPGLAMACSP